MSISVKSGGGENVTPEVTAQTPLVTEILESLVGKVTLANATPETILEGYSAYVKQKLVQGTNGGKVEHGTVTITADSTSISITSALDEYDEITIRAKGAVSYPASGFALCSLHYVAEPYTVSIYSHHGSSHYATHNNSTMSSGSNEAIISKTGNKMTIDLGKGESYKFKAGTEYVYTIIKRV